MSQELQRKIVNRGLVFMNVDRQTFNESLSCLNSNLHTVCEFWGYLSDRRFVGWIYDPSFDFFNFDIWR